MLIVRAPMRISFAGGGTDLPAYYERYSGMVISAAIDKYTYVFISPTTRDSLQISSSDYSTFIRHAGEEEIPEEGKLLYARAFMRQFGIRSGYSIFMASEMPPGTGLGSSSSLAVALTKALAAVGGRMLSKDEAAEIASFVEIESLHMPIGRQDHYAAAHGGINSIRFGADGVTVEPLPITPACRAFLDESLLMFFTEQSHDSREILSEQSRKSREDDPQTLAALSAIRGHAEEAREVLVSGHPELLGQIMHRSWLVKRRLVHGITNETIDDAYEASLELGASGGKIAGAGGGGFLVMLCPPERQAAVTAAMSERGLTRSDSHFDSTGARILVNNATH